MTNQAPPVELVDAPASIQPQPTKVKKASKIWLVVIPVLFSLFGLVIGFAIGAVENRIPDANYESTSKILLMDLGKGTSFPHQEVIASDAIFTKCLIKYDLNQLSSLRDLPATDQIDYLKKRLTVESMGDDTQILKLRYVTANPRDAQTVLATVVSTYEKHLNDMSEWMPGFEVSMETLEPAYRGKSVSLDVGFIGYRALIGLVIGFLVGAVFSLILK